jgi:nucleoside-diphosphate-sugar epimerase
MKKILVTGSSGFIGRHAAAELNHRGYQVTTVTSRDADLLDVAQIEALIARVKPTHLAHFAWHSDHKTLWNSPENLRWTAASAELFRAFLDNGGQRAFFAGSCAEYEWSSDQPLHEQNTPSHPHSVYGKSKNVLRQLVQEMAHHRSASVVWGRIFFVYGPGERKTRFAPSILLPLLRNEEAVVRSGNHRRDFLHVDDVAKAVATLLDSTLDDVVNIASGNTVNLGDFGKTLAKIAGREDLLKIEYAEPTIDNPLSLAADVNLLHTSGFLPKYQLEDGLRTLLPT